MNLLKTGEKGLGTNWIKFLITALQEWISLNSSTVPCKKTRDFAHFPYKIAIFEWGFWGLKVLPPPWSPGSKQCEIGGFQKGITCPCASRGCNFAGCQIFSKNYIFLFVYHIVIRKQHHLWASDFSSSKTLTAYNFAAPWGTWTSSTSFEASSLTMFGARWSWEWQDF